MHLQFCIKKSGVACGSIILEKVVDWVGVGTNTVVTLNSFMCVSISNIQQKGKETDENYKFLSFFHFLVKEAFSFLHTTFLLLHFLHNDFCLFQSMSTMQAFPLSPFILLMFCFSSFEQRGSCLF